MGSDTQQEKSAGRPPWARAFRRKSETSRCWRCRSWQPRQDPPRPLQLQVLKSNVLICDPRSSRKAAPAYASAPRSSTRLDGENCQDGRKSTSYQKVSFAGLWSLLPPTRQSKTRNVNRASPVSGFLERSVFEKKEMRLFNVLFGLARSGTKSCCRALRATARFSVKDLRQPAPLPRPTPCNGPALPRRERPTRGVPRTRGRPSLGGRASAGRERPGRRAGRRALTQAQQQRGAAGGTGGAARLHPPSRGERRAASGAGARAAGPRRRERTAGAGPAGGGAAAGARRRAWTGHPTAAAP